MNARFSGAEFMSTSAHTGQRLPFFAAIATTAEVRFDFWKKVTQAGTCRNFLREALQLATAGLAIHFAVEMAHENVINQFA